MWTLVIIAAIFEVGWATGFKYASSPLEWILTFVGIVGSFLLLVQASKTLPTSTVYAVFVALGTVGTVFVDIYFFNSSLNLVLFFFLILLLVGVLGLKFVTDRQVEERRQE